MKLISGNELQSFRIFIEKHDFFYIAGHKEPDGDCVCSCIVLGALVESFGKQCQLLSAGPFKRGEVKQFESRFSNSMDFLTEDERKRSALIIADCSELSRLGDIEGDLKGLDVFVIDHHKTAALPENALGIIHDDAPAACALVEMLWRGIRQEMPADVAEILFTGLCTDTGFFHFLSRDSAEVFRLAARLVDAGANPRDTYDFITGGKTYESRKLLAAILSHAERHFDGKLIIVYETLEDTQKWGQEGRDSDALYSLLLAVEGVEAIAFLRQETEYSCTAGFRSRSGVDVSSVATKFGGGGHKNAAGASCEGRLDTLIPSVIKEFSHVL